MNLNASGSLLSQYTAVDALSNTVLQAAADLQVEVTRIVICNTSAAPVACDLYHDDVGAGYTVGNALLYGKSIPANEFLMITTEGPNGGLHVRKGGAIGFKDASSGDLTISIYGITNNAFQQ